MTSSAFDPLFQKFRTDLEAECAKSAEQARRDLLKTLNQHFRRIRSYESENDWVRIALEAAAPYSSFVALFKLNQNEVSVGGQQPEGTIPNDCSFPLASARAMKGAVDGKEPVTALRTESEVSAALSAGHAGERAHIFPITNSDRVSALLFAADSGVDLNALELVTSLASSVLERKPKAEPRTQILPLATVPAMAPPRPKALPSWAELPPDERQLHIRAQRFARVAVAELQLARPEACRAGREQGDLYLFLKREIDKNRESYRKQFMTIPSMVDYLHLELIQSAAQGDERKLGVDYPGRLV